MHRYILNRILQALIVLWLVSVITFTLTRLAPGGPTILLAPGLEEQQIEAMRERLGLDDPAWLQYVKWLRHAATGNFGVSFDHHEPVTQLVLRRLPASLLLAVSALLLTVVVGIPSAIVSAVKQYSVIDYAVTVISFLGVSIPSFWLGIMLIMLFSVRLKWLPSAGMMTVGSDLDPIDRLRHLLMPALTLGIIILPQVTRYARSSMLSQLAQDYVRTARSKGLRGRTVLTRHVLRNAMLPIVTILGYYLPRLLGGTVVIETVFGWPGLGRLAYTAAVQRDYPVIMGTTMIVALFVVVINIIVDVLYAMIDPRIRYT